MFRNRVEAGRRLAQQLVHLRPEHPVVLGLPRGGVPVAFEVAKALDAPLDVIVVRKLGVPYQPELAMGAIGEGGVRVVDPVMMRRAGVTDAELAEVEEAERAELERRARVFRGSRPPIPLGGRTVIVVDDGIATGSTVRAAIHVARAHGAQRVVVAAPVAPVDIDDRLGEDADELVVVERPRRFAAIGQFYADFSQTDDGEVQRLLIEAVGDRSTGIDSEVGVPAGGHRLEGRLMVPPAARGLVVFSHGSGSSHRSPRNRHVANVLNQAGFGTLLFDLLTPAEEGERANVFDVRLLADRLVEAAAWVNRVAPVGDRRPAFFGASTGAAAALIAAARLGDGVSAVVSRGGRPDLAGESLRSVTAPTLLIVGAADSVVVDLNRRAQGMLRSENRLELVPGAGHLFEEPGALDTVARLARDWFGSHMAPSNAGLPPVSP